MLTTQITVSQFQEWCTAKGLSEGTIKDYTRKLYELSPGILGIFHDLFKFPSDGATQLSSLEYSEIKKLIESLKIFSASNGSSPSLSAKTARNYRSALACYANAVADLCSIHDAGPLPSMEECNAGEKENDLIWHYTGIDTFVSFFNENSHLYATHSEFLNDDFEVAYGRVKVANLLKKRNLDLPTDELKERNVYVMCFSHAENNLPMWQAYTPRGGVSVAFSKKELVKNMIQSHGDTCRVQGRHLMFPWRLWK